LRYRLSPWADCLVWMLVGWLAIFTVSILLLALLRMVPNSPSLESYFGFVPNLLGISLVLILGMAGSSSSWVEVFSLRQPPWTQLPAVALSTVGLALLGAELDTYLEEFLPPPAWVNEIFRRALEYHTTLEFLGVFLFLVVVAPLTEELLFRGLILHRLSEGHSRWHAIAGSALCFGVFHLIPWQAVGAGLVGLYLGFLVVQTRSIVVSIFAHGVFNLVPVAATGLASRYAIFRQLSAEDASVSSHLPGAWLLGAAFAFAAGIAWIRRAASPPPAAAAP
jgi:CAAX protease family protein